MIKMQTLFNADSAIKHEFVRRQREQVIINNEKRLEAGILSVFNKKSYDKNK